MDHYFLTLINRGGPLCTIQRLKANCDGALSNFAFNFNPHRYVKEEREREAMGRIRSLLGGGRGGDALVAAWQEYEEGATAEAGAYTRSHFRSN
jgi:hypothetical protein